MFLTYYEEYNCQSGNQCWFVSMFPPLKCSLLGKLKTLGIIKIIILVDEEIKVSHVSWRNYSNLQDRFQYLVSTQSISCVLLRVFLCNQESGFGSLSKEIFGVSISYR